MNNKTIKMSLADCSYDNFQVLKINDSPICLCDKNRRSIVINFGLNGIILRFLNTESKFRIDLIKKALKFEIK